MHIREIICTYIFLSPFIIVDLPEYRDTVSQVYPGSDLNTVVMKYIVNFWGVWVKLCQGFHNC